ncbi:MAG TPA: Re/Si-specific NAD(P)(+) transhydrogenase subunit alpha, partial [Parasegetibacter sp.]
PRTMIIGVLKEPGYESRVSLLPDAATALLKKGWEVWIEKGAGAAAFSDDSLYTRSGALVKERKEITAGADIILSIHLDVSLIDEMRPPKKLIGVYYPLINPDLVKLAAEKGLTLFSMDMLPRISRAQPMDVLSSQANIAGYKAVLLAANRFPRYFPMLMTAAGSISPAKVLVIGAGVAGLQAVATARRLGAVVEVFDTRQAVKEEVNSLGAKFVEVEGAADASGAGGYAVEQSEDFLRGQKAKIAERISRSDILITTAQIPGKRAPLLVTDEMVASMKPGSVIIDLAAATGGNTTRTVNNQEVFWNGVHIIGNSNLAASMPVDASRLYGKNVIGFISLLFKENETQLNFSDELVKGTCIAHEGKITNERVIQLLQEKSLI